MDKGEALCSLLVGRNDDHNGDDDDDIDHHVDDDYDGMSENQIPYLLLGLPPPSHLLAHLLSVFLFLSFLSESASKLNVFLLITDVYLLIFSCAFRIV